ncbi:MAG: UDP-N-acetylmuramoyl-tripeptide--D-alanyl-D-alanine ligase [Alphaproteobacteria bacterium]|nr:UDP-N-acetylmuramoyl-tripeptide--D-alanyl-D-alanine ligase [Alphaproteobacteria bacterium]
MKELWTSTSADKIMKGTSTKPWVCTGISIDTRTLKQGDLFVALKGETGDGHLFLSEAARQKAAAALVSEKGETDLPTLRVSDTLKALEALGNAARERSHATRIAVTGSVGKTSTKEMLKWVFKDQGITHGSVASYNNHWGVPLTLARMPQETEYGIFEVGMNHPNEIRPLSQMIKPHISIITSIVECHIEFFKSEAEIARAKAEIYEGMERGASVLLNQDNPHFPLLSALAQGYGLKVYSFGKTTEADFRLLSYEGESERSIVLAEIGGERVSYILPVPGVHWIYNSLAVLGAVFLAGANVRMAAKSLATLEPPSGRGKRYKGEFTVIDESYNANPTSMRAALATLGQSQGKRKIAVIGDMREMGEIAQQRHEELLEPLLHNKIDLVFCCGPYMAYLYDLLPPHMKGGYALTSLELIPFVLKVMRGGDVVSVKASLGTHMKPIVEALLAVQKDSMKKVS